MDKKFLLSNYHMTESDLDRGNVPEISKVDSFSKEYESFELEGLFEETIVRLEQLMEVEINLGNKYAALDFAGDPSKINEEIRSENKKKDELVQRIKTLKQLIKTKKDSR